MRVGLGFSNLFHENGDDNQKYPKTPFMFFISEPQVGPYMVGGLDREIESLHNCNFSLRTSGLIILCLAIFEVGNWIWL